MLYKENDSTASSTGMNKHLMNNGGEQVWINSNSQATVLENPSFESTIVFHRQIGNQVDTFPVHTFTDVAFSSCEIFKYILEGQDASLS